MYLPNGWLTKSQATAKRGCKYIDQAPIKSRFTATVGSRGVPLPDLDLVRAAQNKFRDCLASVNVDNFGSGEVPVMLWCQVICSSGSAISYE